MSTDNVATNGPPEEEDVPPGFGDLASTSTAPPPQSTSTLNPFAPSVTFKPAAAPDAPAAPCTAEEVGELADALAAATQLNTTDVPDASLEGLREREEAEITTQTAEGSIYNSASSFKDLPLSEALLKGLYVEKKFERPSRIQAMTLPMILLPPYRDLIAQAHNGSGKTTCFVLAMLSRVDPGLKEPQGLLICPTRELVLQNLKVLNEIGTFSGITTTSTAVEEVPGANYMARTIKEQIVVGTHGKLKAWVSKRVLGLNSVVILVLDEADEMLKADSFADDSVRLIKSVRKANPSVQLLLFSATFNDIVRNFAMKIAPNANKVFVAKEELSLDVIAQYIVSAPDRAAKTRILKEFIFPNCEKLGQTIIFVRTREMAATLHKEMEADGYKCTSIRGDMVHAERDRVVQEFRNGVTKVLISTDLLSRGFDVSQVTLVINYDVPVDKDQKTPAYETYMHRIGRSGRFGRKGAAFNLVCNDDEERVMRAIQRHFNKQIERITWNDEDKFIEVLEANM